ncbi:MAG: hypothetical protein QXD13_01570 [Candidatus Pacearchaeota archaeon]
MSKVERLFKSGRISRIVETERERYLNFFSNSYKENLEHCRFVLEKYPRWSIISGYYAMHDIAKLFLADKFSIKVNLPVHENVIILFKELIKDGELAKMLDLGYEELMKLMNDLVKAKKKRTTVQYYTGTKFMKEKYKQEAKKFLAIKVSPFIEKIRSLRDDN